MTGEAKGFGMDEFGQLEDPLGAAAPEGIHFDPVAVGEPFLACRLGVDEDAVVVGVEGLDRFPHPGVADLIASAHPRLRCGPDHSTQVVLGGVGLVTAAHPLGDRLPVLPELPGVPTRRRIQAYVGEVLSELLPVRVEVVEIQGVPGLPQGYQ